MSVILMSSIANGSMDDGWQVTRLNNTDVTSRLRYRDLRYEESGCRAFRLGVVRVWRGLTATNVYKGGSFVAGVLCPRPLRDSGPGKRITFLEDVIELRVVSSCLLGCSLGGRKLLQRRSGPGIEFLANRDPGRGIQKLRRKVCLPRARQPIISRSSQGVSFGHARLPS